jgi:hypothetical protein
MEFVAGKGRAMRKWGVVITLFYAAIVLGILTPAAIPIAGGDVPFSKAFYGDLRQLYAEYLVWIPVAIVVAGEAVLLFVTVDTSFRKLKPQTHIAISCAAGAMLFGLLAFAAIYCVGSAAEGDKFGQGFLGAAMGAIGVLVALWVTWGVVFYLFFRNSSETATRLVSWLLKGSVLELLIAVPCHVIVRRRGDCCAPAVTSFGIVTGIAVMLLSFGPSVLLLYKKRLDGYEARVAK